MDKKIFFRVLLEPPKYVRGGNRSKRVQLGQTIYPSIKDAAASQDLTGNALRHRIRTKGESNGLKAKIID